jgi:hypothetical protein
MGIIQWLKNRSERAELSRTAWENIEHKEDNSLTVFQNQCNKQLFKAFENDPDLMKGRNIEGTSEKYITGTLPNTDIKYWIYEDGAQIEDRRLERWDYETPEALIDDFISTAKKKRI